MSESTSSGSQPPGGVRRRAGKLHWDRRRVARAIGLGLAGVCVLVALYLVHLDRVIASRFAGRLWSVPAAVYARPLELHAGRHLAPQRLVRELRLLGYREERSPKGPGTFARRSRRRVSIDTREFRFWDGVEAARRIDLHFDGEYLFAVTDRRSGDRLSLVRLDPLLMGSLYPGDGEDRIIVGREDVPPLLVDAILAVEDRRFYQHHGVDLRGTLRAVATNLKAGEVVQGGSTLTQQLVRSFFLHNRRSILRKLNEALMAVLLEQRYDKERILNAYLNEIYMGQDGRRAVHGFGLASYFYFDKPVAELEPHEIALLVGMVKGPSLYDPRRNPDHAKERRNLVIDILARDGVLGESEAREAKREPLVTTRKGTTRGAYHPAFLELVRRDLAADYDEDDLDTAGLRIFSTLDPIVQLEAERAMSEGLHRLSKRSSRDSLQGAIVVTSIEDGEVQAVVGGRDPRLEGFNRALSARRPIGSLVKPAVYLLAIESGRYTLASTVEDEPLEVKIPGGKTWTPANFDREFMGEVPLARALIESRNVPTVRVGLDLGVEKVQKMLSRLGLESKGPAYPSMLLGAIEASPYEVAQMYNTLANGGFRTRLRAVREVSTAEGERLSRYRLSVESVCSPATAYQIGRTLQATTHVGTARALSASLPGDLEVAGKTGSTDDLRDSWFAGFSGDRLAVVWVGRDDNAPAGLTGAAGALSIFADVVGRVAERSYEPPTPPGVEEVWMDLETGRRSAEWCDDAVRLPFLEGREPDGRADCGGSAPGRAYRWLRDLFH